VSYASLLTHSLALIAPTTPDPDDVDEYGHPLPGTPETTLIRGLVQPRKATEALDVSQAGAELSTHVIFLLPQVIPPGAYIRDEPDAGRRFDITGVRSHEYGTVPHLEVDVKLVGSTEGPSMSEGS
jgi:hypothetical protein